MRFKQIAVIETVCVLLGITATVVTAARGAGPYSLILGPLTNQVLLSLVFWVTVRWRPRA